MTFNSVEDAIRYIEMVVNQAMYDMADEMKEIMDTVTQEQVEGWTYQIFDSVIAQAYGREAIAEFTDNGHWVSWNQVLVLILRMARMDFLLFQLYLFYQV